MFLFVPRTQIRVRLCNIHARVATTISGRFRSSVHSLRYFSIVAKPEQDVESPKHRAWDMLMTAAFSPRVSDRTNGIRALGLLRNNLEARQLAENALSDPSTDVRRAAATALGQMHAKESIPKLQGALSDKKGPVVMAAAQSLRELNDEKSAYAVREPMAQKYLNPERLVPTNETFRTIAWQVTRGRTTAALLPLHGRGARAGRTERAPQHLAVPRPRQLVDEVDGARCLIRREPPAAVRQHIVR